MSRQWRIEYAGALYHVMSRGNQGQRIFSDDNDRRMFLDILGEVSERFSIELHAYVLMGNHYHLLLKTFEPNLSRAMQWFGTTYTRRYNIRHGLGGHLFQGRFKSLVVENDSYLSQLSCYIHRNPLRAGLVNRLADYSWSSYNHYAYTKKPPQWLKTDPILNQSRAKDKHAAYRARVQRYSEEKGHIWEDIKHGLIYGSANFVDVIKDRFLKQEKDPELPQHNQLKSALTADEVLYKTAELLECESSIFDQFGRVPIALKENRDIIIYHLWKNYCMSNQQIGDIFNLTYSAISKIVSTIRRRYEKDQEFQKRALDLISQFKV